jgi:hypothetical protein
VTRVVERCPNCGVEHDDPVGGQCEVCGTQLRYWCRVHGPEIGFMDTAACPRCAAEAARPVPPPRPAPAPPPTTRAPHRPAPTRVEADEPPAWTREEPRIVRPEPRAPRRPGWGGREPHVVIRDGAEDLAPIAAAGAVRLVRAFFALLRAVVGWTIFGAVAGGVYASYIGADVVYSALFGAMVAGCAGLIVGGLRALMILFSSSRPPDG